jgi:hypothetical protein
MNDNPWKSFFEKGLVSPVGMIDKLLNLAWDGLDGRIHSPSKNEK